MATRYQQEPNAEAAPLENGLMVLEPTSNKFCALNSTSTMIWSQLEEPASPEQLAEFVSKSFQGVSASDALPDVQAILEEMTSLGIVVTVE